MQLSNESKNDIYWWKTTVLESFDFIKLNNPNYVISTDASLKGWGAKFENVTTGGLFTQAEKTLHINVLELKAIHLGLKSLCRDLKGTHIKVLSDNSTSVFCINNMGSCASMSCDFETKMIWNWAIERNIWISASHIPGSQNTEADKESRKNETYTEWKLNENIFSEIISNFEFQPNIDLFASRINKQLSCFVSYRPDPEATHINSFTIDWSNLEIYAFPPFSCIGKVLQKIIHDKAKGIIVVPNWPTQPWYSLLLDVTSNYFIIPHSSHQLYLPNQPSLQHPLHKSLELMACLLGV